MKYYIILIVRFLLKVFYIFPIKNDKIFFSSYEGKQFSCNPKSIFLAIYKKYPEKQYIWCLNKPSPEIKKFNHVRTVKYHSFLWVYQMLSSGIIIINNWITSIVPLRKRQIIINTWHGGGAYKKFGMSWGQNKADSKNFSMAYSCTTYFISSCKEFDKAVADAYNIKKSKILPIGMPRNDIFFKKINDSVIKTREKLNIEPEFGIVLYAPTYMGSIKKAFSNTTLNIENLRRVLKYSYHKNFIILIRSHYYVNSEMLNIRDAIDVTDYDVLQELLLISDILITDYSSISWDFSLQKKPCFIFAPNLNYYTTTDRNFYTPIEKWPWPIAQTNEELNDNIMNFNQNKYLQKLEEHWNYMGSYERGKATKEIIKIIERSF